MKKLSQTKTTQADAVEAPTVADVDEFDSNLALIAEILDVLTPILKIIHEFVSRATLGLLYALYHCVEQIVALRATGPPAGGKRILMFLLLAAVNRRRYRPFSSLSHRYFLAMWLANIKKTCCLKQSNAHADRVGGSSMAAEFLILTQCVSVPPPRLRRHV